MNNPLSKRTAPAVALAIASIASAAPFSVTYTDTVSDRGFISDINVGEQAKVTLVLDNGGTSTASQTWTAADVQCVIFTFNNTSNKFAAINYGGSSFPITTGSFTTDGSGNLQAGTLGWDDDSDGIAKPVATNITDVTGVGNWYLDGTNTDFVVELTGPVGGPVNFTNFANTAIITDWSNPTSANGVCASFFAPPPTPNPASIPTLSQWALMVLSTLIGLAAILGLRRYRR
ncbi:MAG TPA: IPTL-CTERM sorting domain-containing protein [Casimicrobiaceae bacterium]|nr:IPTL-CTERM sorting domain-containing protein [Casimicrobiaceae bacterium]